MSRPERIAPPELFYNEKEATKYTHNSRIMKIQTEMAVRCIELLNLPEGSTKLLLDVGCGSGLSGEVLSEDGHSWVGIDISPSMLEIAVEREVEGDVLLGDMGQGFGFRAGMFDGAISVSALQWLCYSDQKDHKAAKRLTHFFSSLYRALCRGGRAALQLYPETPEQLELVSLAARNAGFSGGIVVDYPHSTKAKKYYLCITAGGGSSNSSSNSSSSSSSSASSYGLPAAKGAQGGGKRSGGGSELMVASRAAGGYGNSSSSSSSSSSGRRQGMEGDDDAEEDEEEDEEEDDEDDDDEGGGGESRSRRGGGGDSSSVAGSRAGGRGAPSSSIAFESRRERSFKKQSRVDRRPLKMRDDVMERKERMRRKGMKVRPDTKYTGRKRSGKMF